MNKVIFLIIILTSVFLTSCQKDKDPVIIYDIQDEFNIEILQELNNSGNFFLKITTLDEYPDNYRIEADAITVDDNIEVNIYRILKSPNPTNHKTFISQKIKLGHLELGNHPLDLIIRNSVINEGAISMNPASVELDFSTKHGITAKHYEVNRIAPNGYWGIAYVDIEAHTIFIDQYLQKIKAVSTEITNPKPGNYGYFSIDDQNQVTLPFAAQENFKTFYMTSDEFDTIDNWIQEYKSLNVGFHATIFTAQGQVYNFVSYDRPSKATSTFSQTNWSLTVFFFTYDN